ncbi:MAG TPA: hypothetical protein PKA80_02275 [Ignavibacteriaceae bacterium]|nr:hypothetical protein [Ignavibacteriaceae bacterium]
MNSKYFICLILLLNIELLAQYRFSGFASVGYSYVAMNNEIDYTQQTSFAAKLLFEYNLNNHIDTRIDLRASSRDLTVQIREVSINLDYFQHLKFQFGNIKKPFGAENIENIENLSTIGRSYLTQKLNRIGYGDRAIGIQAYYKYSKADPDFPYSYYLFVFRDDGEESGFTARLTRVVDNLSITGNYFLLKTPGQYSITTHAAMLASSLDFSDLSFDGELLLAQDPNEGIKRIKKNENQEVYIIGAKISSSFLLPTSGEIIQAIQPIVLISYYQPDSSVWDDYTIQFLTGANFILDEKFKLRVNTDLLVSKNPVTKKYKGHDARLTLNLQVKF